MRLGFISATLTWSALSMTTDQLLRLPGLWAAFRSFCHHWKPDAVLHTNWHHLLVLTPWLNRQRDFYWQHDAVLDKPHHNRLYRFLEKRIRQFLPVSHAVEATLLRAGVAAQKISVIHNGLSDPCPEALPSEGTSIKLGIVGQVESWKGHDDLLAAFADVAAPSLELHIFGGAEGDFASKLKDEAIRRGVSERIHWHGFVTQKADIYRYTDIVVIPSKVMEALPTVAIEAAFFRRPVIAYDIGGLPEIIQPGVTGTLVPAGNVSALTSAVRELVTDTALRQRMGTAARQRAVEHFGLARCAAEFTAALGGGEGRN
jgi:glycosyltransferase involved in cell wall biosynthesis